jgi:histidine ammonia-lyase
MQLTLDGTSLTLADLAAVLQGRPVELRVAKSALARVRAARKLVDDHVEKGDIVYGLTTGFGKLKSVAIARADLAELQRNLVLSHSCGVGEPLSIPEARAAQILRLNGILRGHSGVRVETVEQLVRLFNKGFVPVVPEKGSVGASGDLAPLAHMAAACMGVGDAWIAAGGAHVADGAKRMKASAALRKIGERPLELAAKEGLSLINGTEVMKAVGSGAALRAANLSKAADAIAALSIEALLGSARPFEQRFADLKGQAAHARCSDNVRRCLAGSEVLKSHANCARVQDAYSLRCTPQVHGASKAALEHVCAILAPELNSVTDNPVLFPDTGEVVSAGQFHGQPISMALDYLAIGLTTLANISERRTEQLVNPDLSHLPAFLTPAPGLNSGFMIAQVTAAALCSENKGLAHPASADTIPTSANQEDHVSMGMGAARKAREIAANTEVVLAIELLCAAQAREFNRELRAGKGAEAAYAALREVVPALKKDRYLKRDIEAARELVASGELVRAVEKVTGPLLA